MDGLFVNWAASGVAFAVLAGLGAGVRHGFMAPGSLNEKYGGQRSQAQSAIEANRVLPELEALILRVAEKADLSTVALTEAEDREQRQQLLRTQLQDVTSLQRLRRIGDLYRDQLEIDRFFSRTELRALVRAIALSVLIVALVPFGLLGAVRGIHLPIWTLWAGGILAVASSVAAGTAWVMEGLMDRALARLLRRHG